MQQNIRLAQLGDLHEIRDLLLSLSHFYLLDESAQLPNWFLNTISVEALLQRLKDNAFQHYIYLFDNKIAGYLALKDGNYLYHLFVSEQYQGKGIAKTLWHHAIAQSPSDCYTLRSSLFAIPVYKRFGFVEDGERGEKDGIGFQPMTLKR